MQCQNLYKSSSKQTIPTICILIHMISFNFVLIIKKSDALHEHILHKIGVLFGLNSKTTFFNIKKIIIQSWSDNQFGFIFYTEKAGNIQVIFNKETQKIGIYDVK